MKKLLITTTLVAFATLAFAGTPEKGTGKTNSTTVENKKLCIPRTDIGLRIMWTEGTSTIRWKCDPKSCSDVCAIYDTDHMGVEKVKFPDQTCSGSAAGGNEWYDVFDVSVDENGVVTIITNNP